MRLSGDDSAQGILGLGTVARDSVRTLASAAPTMRAAAVEQTLARLGGALGATSIHIHDARHGVEIDRSWSVADDAPEPPTWPEWESAPAFSVDVAGSIVFVRLGHARRPGILAITDPERSPVESDLDLLGVVGDAVLASMQSADDDDDVEAFARVAAHDLKSPLSTMRMALNSLAKVVDDPVQSQLLGASLRSSDRMVELIESLLDYATSGGEIRAVDSVDLTEVVADAVADLGIEEGSVVIDALPTVPGNRARLRSMFQNLIGNARKFHRPDVETEILVRSSVTDDTVTIVVDDDGIGIPEESRDAVFAPFVRLGSRERFSGSGIGLASCRRVVESHNGRIWVEESSRGGTAVHVELPLDESG